MLDLSNNTLTCPWHGFCYDATSGECLSAPGAQLEQLPLRVDDGDVWVRVDANEPIHRPAQHQRCGHPPRRRPVVDLTDGWAPALWLGAPAPGGLALPPASPSMAWMYSPRGVFVGDEHLVVADSGNHRVLIWHGMPCCDEQPADVVLGQPDGETEGPAAGGRGPERGMHLPTGVLVHDGRLIVADAWHHRILVWNTRARRPATWHPIWCSDSPTRPR